MEIKLLYSLVEALESELPSKGSILQRAAEKLRFELSYHIEPDDLENLERLTEDKRKKMTGVKEE